MSKIKTLETAVRVPAKGAGSTLFLADGFLSNGHFILSVAWLESLAGARPILKLIKQLEAAQVRDVTAKVQGQPVPVAPKSLEQIVRDVKLKFYRPVNLTKAIPIIEFDKNPNPDCHPMADLKWTQSIQAMAFAVHGHPVKVEINSDYFAILTLDPGTTVMAKRFDRPIAVIKGNETVAIVQPMQSKSTLRWEQKNAKLK